MEPVAPITQDVMTIKRKLPEGGPTNIVGLTRTQLREALLAVGVKEKQAKMRVNQIWQWIYHWGVRDFAVMTNLAKDFRATLAEHFVIDLPEVVSKHVSADGTRKYLVRIAGGHEVEVVYIPETDRGTLCISSQVGCTLTCSFCHTGTQKLVRNLTAGEIVGQVMLARDDLDEWPEPGQGTGAKASPCPAAVSPCRPLAWSQRSRAQPKKSAASWRSAFTRPRTRSVTSWCRSTSGGTSRNF